MYDETMTTVTVRTYKESNSDCPPENLYDFIAEMQGHLETIPEEYRTGTKIQFRSYRDYDDCDSSIIGITYERPETPKDAEARRAAGVANVMEDIEWLEQRIVTLRQDAAWNGVDLKALGVGDTMLKALTGD